MAQLVVTARDIKTGSGIANAEVKVTGQGHGYDPFSPTYNVAWTNYTNSSGQCFFTLNLLDSYNITIDITAGGYYSASSTVSTGSITGNFYKTISLTPVSSGGPPPGQGLGASIAQFFAELGNLTATAHAGGIMFEIGLGIVAVIIVAIAIIFVALRV